MSPNSTDSTSSSSSSDSTSSSSSPDSSPSQSDPTEKQAASPAPAPSDPTSSSSSNSSQSSPSLNDPKGKRVASPAPNSSDSPSSSSSSSTYEEVSSSQPAYDVDEVHNVEVGQLNETESEKVVQSGGVDLDEAQREIVLGIPTVRRRIVTPTMVKESCSSKKSILRVLKHARASRISIKKPKNFQIPWDAPEGYICIYEDYFRSCGLRFSIPSRLIGYCNRRGAVLSQLMPASVTNFVGIQTLGSDIGFEVTISVFEDLCNMKNNKKPWYFSACTRSPSLELY
ncbi:osteocalcin 2-like [Eutrema salsugineum]|uniref:osteocalcin 2-like n=1 Tax=Eutrema salsugineum TaxID=72664 RepID=UPI000CED4E04|nr:osteocalcin 2-like [Eutrema salsugineum]